MTNQPLDAIPIWVIYLLTVLLFLAANEIGFRYVETAQRRKPAKSDGGVGAIAGATLALLAFLLAFVVGFAVTIYTERRGLVVKEANAIGTTYLRASFLDEPYRTQARDLLREYVDLRLVALDASKLAAARARSEEIQNELWQQAETIARQSPTPITSLYISALNDVIDVHTERLNVAVDIRIPPTILLGMYVVAVFCMFLVGMQSGYAENRNLVALVVLVLILSVVFFLVLDLDRSQQGLLRVPQQALIDLQQQLRP